VFATSDGNSDSDDDESSTGRLPTLPLALQQHVENDNAEREAGAVPFVEAAANVEQVGGAIEDVDDTPETPPPTMMMTNPNNTPDEAGETLANNMNADEGGLSSTENE
jgi:hypothetical protein